MTAQKVLITGATGHVGFRTLLDLLIAGYRPRIAVRSESKKQLILNHSKFKALTHNTSDDFFEFVIVLDITVPNAYSEAIKDVDYAIHIASPIESGGRLRKDEFDEHLIRPAVRATLNILEAAKSEARVKRVVITSSVYATVPYEYLSTRDMAENEIYTADHRLAFDEGPYADESQAYAASKVKALNESERWMRENEPSFDLVNIHPPFVLGRNDLVTNAEDAMRGTNGVILRPALGKANPNPLPGCSAHLEDIARLHVEALQARIPAGSYQAATNGAEGIRWERVNEIVQQLFPEAVQEGVLPNSGGSKTSACHLDVSKTEETFGWKFQGFERQVESVIEHYLLCVQTSIEGGEIASNKEA
jgi:nucleoside-diphosphate-sugar epimerase